MVYKNNIAKEINMKQYKIVAPENFTKEHIEYIESFKAALKILPSTRDLTFFLKDVNSRIIYAPDTFAIALGAKSGSEIEGKIASELPCQSVAAFADQFVVQEQSLMKSPDTKKIVEVLDIFEFSYGLQARKTLKTLLYHEESDSILGTVHQSTPAEVKNFINIIPSYILRFGAIGSMEANSKDFNIKDVPLTDYEQEICFLLLLNWSFGQIADFMNQFRPNLAPRTANTIIKAKNHICEKLELNLTNKEVLCEYLFASGFHKKLPSSFYRNMLGSTIVN